MVPMTARDVRPCNPGPPAGQDWAVSSPAPDETWQGQKKSLLARATERCLRGWARGSSSDQEVTVIMRELTYVRAAHDIRRGDHIVVKYGSPGRVLYSHASWFETTYTVNFPGIGRNHQGAITLIGLNTDDVQPRGSQ